MSGTRLRYAVLLAVLFAGLAAGAQDAPQGPGGRGGRGGRGGGGMMMMGGGNAGQITAISGDTITVKSTTGSELTIKTTADTRVMGKDRQQIALKDLKVGDYIGAGGRPGSDGVVDARFIAVLDEQAMGRIKEFQQNLGKTVIAGEIKAINDTRLTIARSDGQTQDIELDESTSLKRGRDESITLADVKVGDRVMGQGALKNGIFVPTELHVMTPGMGRERRGGQQGPPQGQAPQEPPK